MFRKLLRICCLSLCLFSAEVSIAQSASNAVVIMYHHVSSTSPRVTSVSADEFRQHMEYLRDQGFSVQPLETVVKALREGSGLPDKTVAITFDDAYVSVYDTAFPLLRSYDWPFTIFINSGLIDSNDAVYLTWEQLREMGAAGATLANHTISHPYMLERDAGEDDEAWLARARHEIVEAEAQIERETGQSHKLFAYPFGEYDRTLQELVRELGYVGFGQQSGPINGSSDFTALPRFPFSGVYTSIESYATKVNSLAFDVQVRSPESPVSAEPRPEAVLDFDGDYRLDALNCFNNDQPMQVTMENAAEQVVRISPRQDNKTRRFRYNCTAPGPEGRYYWYTITWLNPAIKE